MRAAAADAALPPHPLDKRWFVHVDGTNYGPYSGHEIKRMIGAGQVQESDFLCVEGAQAWVQAKNEPLLGAMFRTQTMAPPPPTITTTAEGGTIVQVTNNIPNQAANLAQAALLLNVEAASKSPGVACCCRSLSAAPGKCITARLAKAS